MVDPQSAKLRIGLHFVLRLLEVLLLYGHFLGALWVAGDVLRAVLPDTGVSPGWFALPLLLCCAWQLSGFACVFVWEHRVAGLPRIPAPSGFFGFCRRALKASIVVGIVVCFLVYVLYSSMSIRALVAEHASAGAVVDHVCNISVSMFALLSMSLLGGLWWRRLSDSSVSCFVTVPATVVHMLPNVGSREALMKQISVDGFVRVFFTWGLGLSVVLLAVTYSGSFFPDWSSDHLVPQLAVGLVFWALISAYMTVFFVKSRTRELDTITGLHTPSGRNALQTWVPTLAMIAALLLAGACFAASTYRIVSTLVSAEMTYLEFSMMIVGWPIFFLYAGMMLDTMLTHLKNKDGGLSVCSRQAVALQPGSDYLVLSADTELAYEADF